MQTKKFMLPLLLTIILSFVAEQSNAIPAFARKYRLSCNTCHTPAAPKLKDYGDSFAGNGFRLEDEDSPGYYVPAGDEKLSLIRSFPIAARMDGFVTYNVNNNEQSDFQSPYLIKLLSGGELSERFSYYFYFYMDERGEVAGVEDAFLMYNNLFGIDLDIYLGQFQISDPLFKRELRLTLEDYQPYISQIGMSQINLKYDKGVMLTLGLETGTTLAFEVLNGNGLPEARDHVFDNDQYKNVLGRISQGIGDQLSIGAFAFKGKENQENGGGNQITNDAFIYGPDLTFAPSDMFEMNLQYTAREDSRIYPSMESDNFMEDVETNGVIGEAIFSPHGSNSDWYLAGLYNLVESDYDPADYQSFTLHAGYLARTNIRLVTEYSLIETHYRDRFGMFSLGFVSGF